MISENAVCMFADLVTKAVIAAIAIKLIVGLVNIFWIHFSGSLLKPAQYGTWSVVTGATDGIGLAFAKQLAQLGQNIVLISRNKEKLENVSSDIKNLFQVETKMIVADFAQNDIYENIFCDLQHLDIGVLVNNVGISYENPEFFLNVPNLSEMIDKMISVNITSTCKMTRYILPKMVLKNKGVILNVSSGAADQPTPLLTLYSASKMFVDCFAKCLSVEYADEGIIVQSFMPYYVSTKLSKIRRSSLFVPTPQKYVQSALKTVGKASRTYGYLPHAIQGFVFSLLPECVYMKIASSLNLSIQKRAAKIRREKRA